MSQISKQAHEALVAISAVNGQVHTKAHDLLSELSGEILGEVLAALKFGPEDRRIYPSLAEKTKDILGARQSKGVRMLVFEILDVKNLEARAAAAAGEFAPMAA
jgi:hypothetical protein